MAFEPRLSAPESTNKWWIAASSGGQNKCVAISGNSVLPSCTGYAWGRFSELLGQPCNLPTSYADTWWTLPIPYEKGDTPKVGAVAVWRQDRGDGHVGVVEMVNSDGSIVVSNSSGGGLTFYLSEHTTSSKYAIDSKTKLAGFIYNPQVDTDDPRHKFVEIATERIKDPQAAEWSWKYSKLGVQGSWNAAFIVAVGNVAGRFSNRIIYPTTSSSDIIRKGVSLRFGEWHTGPFWGQSYNPSSGDIIALRRRNPGVYKGQDRYACDKIGIVQNVNKTTVNVIIGDESNAVIKKEYDVTSKQISGYFRPDWSIVGGSVSGANLQSSVIMSPKGKMTQNSQIFTNYNPDDGAILREVGYLTSDGEPSINVTDIKLCVINCISKLAELTGGYADLSTSNTVNMDRIASQPAKQILSFLLDSCNLNAAQSIGVLANIQAESGFRTDAENPSSHARGICQWLGDRRTRMVEFCGGGDKWKSDLTGQLNYLWLELTTGYQNVLNALNSQVTQLTADAAAIAADIFVRKFEIPENIDQNSKIRQQYAKDLWKSITLIPNSSNILNNNTNGVVRNRAGNILSNGTRINIPANVDQGGIIPNYTNYGYFYGRWNKSTVQYQLSEIWASQGKPSSRGIATIDSYYLIAVSPKIGRCGNIITVVLEDGTSFNAIIGDEKGTDAQTDWGHIVSGHVDIVEWEKAGRSDNHVDTDTKIDLTGWAKKKVAYCINYGAYL